MCPPFFPKVPSKKVKRHFVVSNRLFVCFVPGACEREKTKNLKKTYFKALLKKTEGTFVI